MSWAEAKRQAQRTVHNALGLPAEYYPPGSDRWVLTNVRLHTKTVLLGDNGNAGYVEHYEDSPIMAFLDERFTPEEGATVKLDGSEYRLINLTDTNSAGVQFWVVRSYD